MPSFGRRQFCLAGAGALATGLAGCASGSREMPGFGELFGNGGSEAEGTTISRPDYKAVYGAFSGEKFPVEAFDYRPIDPKFLRQTVTYDGPEAPGTVVVHPSQRMLYFVEPDRRATRYGVGVGREGFAWSGRAQINMRRSWPDWIPPHEMVARQPEIVAELQPTPRGEGVPGGPRSPLGARAMYLFGKNGDLGYRLHGTTEPWTIGTDVSSGCVRMVNQDIIHLYSRAPEGTKVIVAG